MEKILDKFLRYVAVDTMSDPDSPSQPSTQKQFNLLNLLCEELKAMGVENVSVDQYGYLMATIPSNIEKDVPAIGFIAHVDSSPDASGADIKPQVFENYDGGDIVINPEKGMKLSPADFPELRRYIGQTIVTTDGTTLLGADDKAGVAEIMCAAEYIMTHPEFKHGEIKIGFTPDEEIGRGVDYFDVAKFGAKYAYTMDGGQIGELEYENFNAAGAKITVQGRNIHPGYAKDKMVNAIILASELNDMLPVWQRPEHTTGYEGFFHIVKFSGVVEEATIQYIIRDHDFELFEQKKRLLEECVAFMNAKYGEGTFTLEMKDQYYNMRKEVEPHYHIIETAVKAMEEAGIEVDIRPIRGGTDGARLSFMGLPCPNIFAGGHNFHGKFEYVPVESMEKATEVILNILKIYAQ
ncbi:MAG: peptidase T [Bacteroidales bacterium]|jgi:tripeptide aminopeptidase|nr:peptidase T [Bacteroidales bacterium]MBQ5881853.1 peptidase T [Bacteroidales bacterium]